MSSQKVKFGVLGCSRVALKGMLPAIVDSGLAELTMIGSRDPEKAGVVAKQFGLEEWGTYEDVLRNKNIDAVYVSLPNALHEEWSVKSLRAGKHVICEKPAGISYAAAKRMVEAAKQNNVRLLEGFMFRYHPQHAKVREFIGNGTLGDLLKFEGCFAYALPERESASMSKILAGGSIHACMPYPIYTSRMIFGEEPESVICKTKIDLESGVDLKTDMMLSYSNNRSAFATSVFGSYYQSTYSVLGTKAHVRMGRAYAVPRDMQTKIFLDRDDKIEEIVIEPADHFRLMVDDFCNEVLKGNLSDKKYEEDLLNQARVLEAARLSDREKRIVKISEIDLTDSVTDLKIKALPTNSFEKILLTGGSGNLGRAVMRSGLFPNILAPSHSELDITKPEDIKKFFEEYKPDAVIHAAAVVKMAQSDKDALRVETNVIGTANLVYEALNNKTKEGDGGIRFIYISTDGVYEGTKGNYSEDNETIPYNNYGWTKLAGECVVKALSNYCIIRTSFFDPENIPFDTAATDMFSSKMPVNELPKAILTLLFSTFKGIVNVGDEKKSHYDRYKEAKKSIKPSTFYEITKNLDFKMAKDATLNVTLWKKIKDDLENNGTNK